MILIAGILDVSINDLKKWPCIQNTLFCQFKFTQWQVEWRTMRVEGVSES